jgi:hypothetical protein
MRNLAGPWARNACRHEFRHPQNRGCHDQFERESRSARRWKRDVIMPVAGPAAGILAGPRPQAQPSPKGRPRCPPPCCLLPGAIRSASVECTQAPFRSGRRSVIATRNRRRCMWLAPALCSCLLFVSSNHPISHCRLTQEASLISPISVITNPETADTGKDKPMSVLFQQRIFRLLFRHLRTLHRTQGLTSASPAANSMQLSFRPVRSAGL